VTVAALIIAIVSALAAAGSAFYAFRQVAIAKEALRASEASAEAAKRSADTSVYLAQIEADRYWRERKPKWRALVERCQAHRQPRLRLALESGDVQSVVVNLSNRSGTAFSDEQPNGDGLQVVSPCSASFGPVEEGASAYWHIKLPKEWTGQMPAISVRSSLGGHTWLSVLAVSQDRVYSSVFDEPEDPLSV
jgi:hypothetical protein